MKQIAISAVLAIALAGSAFAQTSSGQGPMSGASSTNPASGGSNSPYGGAPRPNTGTTNPSR